jgi:hypothetical protein
LNRATCGREWACCFQIRQWWRRHLTKSLPQATGKQVLYLNESSRINFYKNKTVFQDLIFLKQQNNNQGRSRQ